MFGVEPVMAMVRFLTLGLPQIQCIKVREAVFTQESRNGYREKFRADFALNLRC
jgi:hypothetical protein